MLAGMKVLAVQRGWLEKSSGPTPPHPPGGGMLVQGEGDSPARWATEGIEKGGGWILRPGYSTACRHGTEIGAAKLQKMHTHENSADCASHIPSL